MITHLEPDILQCEVKRALGSINMGVWHKEDICRIPSWFSTSASSFPLSLHLTLAERTQRDVCFQAIPWKMFDPGGPETQALKGVLPGQNYFHLNMRLFLPFHGVDLCIDGTKALVSEASDPLV